MKLHFVIFSAMLVVTFVFSSSAEGYRVFTISPVTEDSVPLEYHFLDNIPPKVDGTNLTWEEYKEKFNKHYNEQDDVWRKEKFLACKVKVREHNKRYNNGEIGYAIAVNDFCDLTQQEIQDRIDG